MKVGIEITLEQLLNAREQRAEKQKRLIEKFRLPLISFTVNIPGAFKNTPASRSIFKEGCEVLNRQLDATGFNLNNYEQYARDTGHEAYLTVDANELTLKAQVLHIENTHLLGRLFDFDVIGLDGRAISREALGYPKRKCLLCEQDAHVCSRSRRHSVEELTREIQIVVDTYFKGKNTIMPY